MKVLKARRTLITSIIAIVISFSLLIGVTFAWFTDTAQSGINKIKSGNLDVKVTYEGEELNENTKIFLDGNGEEMIWEPGASTYGEFEIANDGSLALKFQLELIYANATATPSGKTLADALCVYAITRGKNTGTDEVMGDVGLNALVVGEPVPGYDKENAPKFSDGVSVEAFLLPQEAVTLEIGVFWKPTENDNEFNIEGGLSIDFAVSLVATQAGYEAGAGGFIYDANAGFPGHIEIPNANGWSDEFNAIFNGKFKLVSDPETAIQLVDGQIEITDSEGVTTIPSDCITINGRNLTISGTGVLDGEYTVFEDGYIQKDGEIFAKSELTWVDLEEMEDHICLIINNGLVYDTYDGNTPANSEPIFALNELSQMTSDYIDSIGGDIDAFEEAYGYRFSEINEGEVTVGNVFDALAVQNIVEDGHYQFGYQFGYIGSYDHWGGLAHDEKTNDELRAIVNYGETDLDSIVTTSLYLAKPDGSMEKMTTDTVVEGGTIVLVQETKYYKDGVETNNVMFYDDYALYYEDGMTYREWMHENFIMELHDYCNCATTHTGIYIPEEYLDLPCEPGYISAIQGSLPQVGNDYFGYYYDGNWWHEPIFYSYGLVTIRNNNFSDEGYEFLGMAWEGGLQTDYKIYADEYYNHFIRQDREVVAVPFYSAFKAEEGLTVVDISEYLTLNGNQVVVDVAGLTSAYSLDSSVSVIPVFERDGYFVDCRDVNGNYDSVTNITSYEATEVSLSYGSFSNGATGITFYYNGVVYTGFAN